VVDAAEHIGRVSPYTKHQELRDGRVPDWDDFRVLMTVLKVGSFNRAAEALGLTQPTVSRRIAGLERAIGARIVDRHTTGATLTLEGQQILAELTIAHSALERAINQTRKQQQKKDEVKLIITDGLAAYWLTHFLPMLYQLYPRLELRIFTANESISDRHGRFDFSVHFLAPTDPDMVSIRLGTLHFIPYASAGYLAEYGQPLSLADFSSHRLLDFTLYLVDKGTWVTRLPDGIGQDRTQLFTSSSAVLAEAVRNGAGIALLPSYASLFEKGMVPIDVDLHLETPFWLCYRQDAATKPSIQIVARFLRHIFNRKTMPWFGDRYLAPSEFPKTTPDSIMRTYSATPPTAI
jgi:molybdate transport repressor ModE-like protein